MTEKNENVTAAMAIVLSFLDKGMNNQQGTV